MKTHTNYKGPEWKDCHSAKEAILGGLEGWRQRVQEWPRKCACEIVKDCAGANTYRAFGRIEKPSRIFRSWGWTFVKSGRLEEIATHPEDFDELHGDLIRELSDYWVCIAEAPLQYGPATKLLNLLILHTCQCYLDPTKRDREKLMNFIHVPLDEYVLRAIRLCFNDQQGKVIPKHPSMGVVNIDNYQPIQGCIRDLTKSSGAPPIIVNYLAWELPHSSSVRPISSRTLDGRSSLQHS